jgi:hypothetical protein
VKNRPLHARHKLNHTGVADVLNQPVDDLVTQLAVSHLPPAESEARLDLVAFVEEADRLVLLGLIVMLVDGDRKLDFLYGDDLLFFAGGALALFFFVKVTAVVLDATDRRNGVGRNFDQIKAALASDS